MNVGICGLGLIGGSAAKAYHEKGHKVYGFDEDASTLSYALLSETIDEVLNLKTISQTDLLLIALYPEDTVSYLKKIAPLLNKEQVVMDLCGIKDYVCKEGFALSGQYGFTYVGGHPMAGTQYSGIKYAKGTLFKNAPLVLVPPKGADIFLLEKIKNLVEPLEFGKISVCDAKEHDEIIAFTSQLAHVVSNAYVKSPTAQKHKGVSAGSYKDLTRVARLNEKMWTDLFLNNKDPLIFEISTLISNLEGYKTALEQEDAASLMALLKEGRIAKEKVDGK